MDYLQLKKTLIAAFDHFLSCHDMRELEEMMRAFELGKSLVIKFPEPIDREDYRDDILGYEEQTKSDDAFCYAEQRKSDDVLGYEEQTKSDDAFAMDALRPKKIASRKRRTKPKARSVITQQKQIKICDIPVLIDLSVISKSKQKQFLEAIENEDHAITFSQLMIQGRHALIMARVDKIIQPAAVSSLVENENPFMHSKKTSKVKSDNGLRKELITKIMLNINKAHDPP